MKIDDIKPRKTEEKTIENNDNNKIIKTCKQKLPV